MPRDGSGVFSPPAGTTATSGTTIESAKYNAFVNDLVTDANTARPIVAGGTGATTAGAALSNLGGQPLDAGLTSIAGLTTAADRMIYTTAADTYAVATLTAAGRALLDDADAAAQRATLGLGALATATTVTTAEIAAATLVTAAETIAANSNDTTIPTSAAVAGYAASKITAGVVYPTTSGTSVSIPSVPAGCKRITIGLNGVSTNGTSHVLLQIGDSGGIETTGYQSGSVHSGGSAESTAGFILFSDTAACTLYGSVTLTLVDAATNLWASSHGGFTRTTVPIAGGGIKALSDVITQMQLTTVSGTPTFDAGSVSVVYET